jgi:dihydroxyacetone kinase-like protein
MKKIMNDAGAFVTEMLEGLVKSNRELSYDSEFQIIYRSNPAQKVGLVSGGGSGHEPAHAGYVGRGMLDAAVAGNVFASPGAEQVLQGIIRADQGRGVLLIIKNYSGDIMNFQMAAELAELEDIEVDYVVVKDDVAVPDSTYSTGRRGIAGTVYVHKIAGAMAERGADLSEVKRVAQKTIENVRSMGMAMSSCVLPAVGKPNFVLGENEIEVGMGIHGEPGVERVQMKTAAEIAAVLTDRIFADYDYQDSKIALMVNGLGATPVSELYILNNEVHKLLAAKKIEVVSNQVGSYMTSLEMTGCSITMLKLDQELEELLNDPAETVGYRN